MPFSLAKEVERSSVGAAGAHVGFDVAMDSIGGNVGVSAAIKWNKLLLRG